MRDYAAASRDSHLFSVTVCAVLAGFSFTAVVGLLAVAIAGKPPVSLTIAFCAFLLATFLFLATVFGVWTAAEWVLDQANASFETKVFYKATFPLFFGALLVFVVGVDATAFVYGVVSGIIASVSGTAFLVYMVYCVVALASTDRQA